MTDKSKTVIERIEDAYDAAAEHRANMHDAHGAMISQEEFVLKGERLAEFRSAKSNEVRKALLKDWLSDDEDYLLQKERYEENRFAFRLAMLEIDRLRLLVQAVGINASWLPTRGSYWADSGLEVKDEG
jgi:hypothetical protein